MTRADDPNQEIKTAEPLKYTRLYCDAAGESHFTDDRILFELVDFAPPAPPISVSKVFGGGSAFLMSSPPGWYGDWHPAPQRQLIFVLSGELEVRVSDGEVRRFGPGGAILVEDTTGKGHVSAVTSDERGYCVVVPMKDA
jgi:hypothetical protein